MTLKKQFPKEDGWITAKLTLNRGATFSEQEAKEFILFGRTPDKVEFGHVDVSRNPLKVIYREIKKPAETPA